MSTRTPYEDTKVTPEKSQTAVRRLLRTYDVEDIQFTMRSGGIFQLVFAKPGDAGHLNVYRVVVRSLTFDAKGERQAMRMMWWWMKAKLESIAFGVADFETEWLPYQLVAGGGTVAESVLPQLQAGGTDVDPFRPALPSGLVQSP